MQVDHLVIGQGISGTLLSRSLLKEGATVCVIDDGAPSSSSKVAGGVINPVTGKRLVKTWLIDELMPFAWDTYKTIEEELNVPLVRKCSILNIHASPAQKEAFEERQAEQREYLHTGDAERWSEYFRFNYGVGEINPCLLVDINTLLTSWREYLKEKSALLEETFLVSNCTITESGITYNDITARNIIFCDGAVCAENPYFERLPWSKDKGEALIVVIPGLPKDHIYNQGINILHWKEDLFWVGATHDWKYTDMQPTPAFRAQVEELLGYWLRLPFTVVDHIVARRPVNVERKPFVGLHPVHTSVGIFNGMGTKGCSVAPYFAHQFARHQVHGEPLLPDVDVRRFTKILSR